MEEPVIKRSMNPPRSAALTPVTHLEVPRRGYPLFWHWVTWTNTTKLPLFEEGNREMKFAQENFNIPSRSSLVCYLLFSLNAFFGTVRASHPETCSCIVAAVAYSGVVVKCFMGLFCYFLVTGVQNRNSWEATSHCTDIHRSLIRIGNNYLAPAVVVSSSRRCPWNFESIPCLPQIETQKQRCSPLINVSHRKKPQT